MVRLLREGLRRLCGWEVVCDQRLGDDKTAARSLPCHLLCCAGLRPAHGLWQPLQILQAPQAVVFWSGQRCPDTFLQFPPRVAPLQGHQPALEEAAEDTLAAASGLFLLVWALQGQTLLLQLIFPCLTTEQQPAGQDQGSSGGQLSALGP